MVCITYPGGGNHFDDWTAPDVMWGANQDLPCPDGMVDLPYVLIGNQDHYPLAYLWETELGPFVHINLPTVGTYIAGAVPVIIALMSGDPMDAVWVIIVITIYQQIENYLIAPRVTKNTMDLHPAVAFGAAMRAAQKSGDAEKFQLPPELKGVTGFNVGVRTVEPDTLRVVIDPLVKKNMPLPTSIRKTYYTTSDLQDQMTLDFVQYRIDESDAVSLGQLQVGPLPDPRPNYPIDVEVDYHEDGTVTVVATDASTGKELQQSFGGASGDDIEYLSSQREHLQSVLIRRP